jgi:adenylylsulfate kinase-like enzyme
MTMKSLYALAKPEVIDGFPGLSVRYETPSGGTLKTWVKDKVNGMDWLLLEEIDLLHRGAGYKQTEV